MLSASFLSSTQPQIYFKSSLLSPQFSFPHQIWSKTPPPPSLSLTSSTKLKFYKVGKIFGAFTKRTLLIQDHIMAYYQNSKNPQIKGHCSLKNLYIGFFIVQSKYKYLVHLTNYQDTICMYFENTSDILMFKGLVGRYVIQLRYNSKFETVRGLGEGSFAEVFLAKKKKGEEGEYAVKVVSKVDKGNNSTKELVAQEKKVLEMVGSELLCKMVEFYEDSTNYYFVLQYIHGKNLMDLFKQNYPFTSSNKQRILKQIASGLLHLHSLEIIHRDIKPQNIMVNTLTLETKIIDLGLSLLLKQNQDLKSFKRCGTMGYIAPEIIGNNSKNKKAYGCKADVFSFGIIAYMLLMGYNPMKGKSYEETAEMNRAASIRWDKEGIRERYGESCVGFLEGCLEVEEGKRLSAVEVAEHGFLNESVKEDSYVSVFEEKIEEKGGNVFYEDEEDNPQVISPMKKES